MHNQNEAFLHLNDALPADIAPPQGYGGSGGGAPADRRRLSSGVQPLLAPGWRRSGCG